MSLFPLELIQALQAEGHPIYPGAVGENLTVAGLDWPSLEVGAILDVGEARLQLTQRVEPCNTIAGAFAGGQFKRIQPDRFLGRDAVVRPRAAPRASSGRATRSAWPRASSGRATRSAWPRATPKNSAAAAGLSRGIRRQAVLARPGVGSSRPMRRVSRTADTT